MNDIFSAIGTLHPDVAKFAYRDLGSACAMHEVIGVRNFLAQYKAGKVDERGDPIDTDIIGNDELANSDRGPDQENLVRSEQGNRPQQPALHRAEHLHLIRLECRNKLHGLGVEPPEQGPKESDTDYRTRAATFMKWNYPQNPAEVLRFFGSSDGTTPQKTIDSFNRLVEQKLMTRDVADAAILKARSSGSKQWTDIAEDVMLEIVGFEPLDIDAVDAITDLELWMQQKLFDDTIKRVEGSCARFVAQVALGNQERFGGPAAEEAEAVAFLYKKERAKLTTARQAFAALHESEIEAQRPVFA